MRHIVLLGMVLGSLVLVPSPARSARYYGFQVGVSNAPPPPVIRSAREPHAVRATDAMVYVVDDDRAAFRGDWFRYGQYWFVYSGAYWYRARSFRGPYAVIDVRKVPRAIIGVPRRWWKHHPLGGPPGQVRRQSVLAAVERPPGRGHGKRHDR